MAVMRKTLLFAFVLGMFVPAILFAQNISSNFGPSALTCPQSAGENTASGGVLGSLPLLKGLKAGKLLLNPSAQIGYQNIGANLDIPVSAVPRGPNELFVGTIGVTLKDFRFWTGTVGLNVIAGPLTLFGTVCGNAPHLFRMQGTVPVSNTSGAVAPDLTFTGSNVEFWTAQAGAAFTIRKDYSILAGFVWSHLGAEFVDPRVGDVPLANQTIKGDVLMKIGVPFIGVQVLQQGYYRAALMYSPLARSSGSLSLQSSSPILADLRYSLNQPGTFLAANGEYYFVSKPPLMLSCWVTGMYVNIRGKSDLDFSTAGPRITRDVTVTNTQYGLGGGVTFGLVF
jgi:hypothetical protein